MRIKKILNNNVVISQNDSENEIVVMGKGVGFSKKIGDIIDSSSVDKTFVLSNESLSNKFQQIISSIPMENFLLTQQIIEYAVTSSNKKYNDVIYISLTDHVNSAIERYRKGIVLPNPLLMDIKRIYTEEFQIGLKAVEILKEKTGLNISEDEAGFIALHFFNSELSNDMNDVYQILEVVNEILEIVKEVYKLEYETDSINYYRFVTYLKNFAHALKLKSSDAVDDELYENAIKVFPDAFICAGKVTDFIQEKYGYEITKEELFHLTINIKRMVRSSKKEGE